MSKIGIDCGHSLNSYDYGAVGIRNESDLTREVGRRVIDLFRQNGHEVVDCTVDNCNSLSDSLYRRYNKANENNCDYYISIHFNAFNGSAKGTEILYTSSPDDKMQRILNNIVGLGYVNRGLKKDTRGLAVLRNTVMKAMLIECCFCDNSEDMNRYNPDLLAKAIVEGFLGRNVDFKIVNNNQRPQEKHISTNLRDWQSAYNNSFGKNILVDGDRGEQVENAMKNAILNRGSFNPLVEWLQCRLGVKIDGDFGKNTYNAVIKFQRENGLVQDGIVGYNTWNCLFRKFYW